MAKLKYNFRKLTFTPELRAFLRAELSIAMSFDGPDGDRWSSLSIERWIKQEKAPGKASDDALRRYSRGEEKARPPVMTATAAFLLANGFITPEDLDRYNAPGYSRAALAIAQVHAPRPRSEDLELTRTLLGEYRAYRMWGENTLLSTTLVLASTDEGRTVTSTEHRAVYRLREAEWVRDETANLDPSSFRQIPGMLRDDEAECIMSTTGQGFAIATSSLAYIAFGGESSIVQSLLDVNEIHYAADAVCGVRARRTTPWAKVVDKHVTPEKVVAFQALLRRFQSNVEFYPQEISVEKMPDLADMGASAPDDGRGGGQFGFSRGARKDVDPRYKLIAEAQEIEDEIEAVMLACATPTERLIVAIEVFRPDLGLDAIAEGADVNALHTTYELPLVHAAAGLGMRELVRAMISVEGCDLTVRDRYDRLASSCADNCAGDFDLRDELIAAQTAQFRARGIDPRRPGVPNHGSYILKREPS